MSGRDRLVVLVGGERAGVLATDPTGRHVYAYDADCPPERFVSLTMPVRLESYAWHELHPVFQVNLPDLAERVRTDARARTRPLEALAALGGTGLGRVVVAASGPSATDPAMAPGRAMTPDPATAQGPAALYTCASGAETEGPFLAWCALRAARRAGFEVPAFELTADGLALRVARFDDDRAGGRLGYEDFCALTGVGSAQRYEGAAEQLVSAAAAFSAPVRRTAVRRELFRRLAFAYAIRDADAHLKRFGLLYSSTADVRLAPLHAAATRATDTGADHGPALAIGGRRAWRAKPGTWRRFGAHCALSDREAQSIFQWLQQALQAELTVLESPAAAAAAAAAGSAPAAGAAAAGSTAAAGARGASASDGVDGLALGAPARPELLAGLRGAWHAGLQDLFAGW